MRRAGREENTTVARKDTSKAVLSMLSVAGSQTRRTAQDEPPEAAPVPDAPPPVNGHGGTAPPGESGAPVAVAAPVTALESRSGHPEPGPDSAPRTMRLRAASASRLRAAWLEAKRDDVLLTAQDFASDLVDEALAARRRRSKALRST